MPNGPTRLLIASMQHWNGTIVTRDLVLFGPAAIQTITVRLALAGDPVVARATDMVVVPVAQVADPADPSQAVPLPGMTQ